MMGPTGGGAASDALKNLIDALANPEAAKKRILEFDAAQAHAEQILSEASETMQKAQSDAQALLSKAHIDAEQALQEAEAQAKKILEDANTQASQIKIDALSVQNQAQETMRIANEQRQKLDSDKQAFGIAKAQLDKDLQDLATEKAEVERKKAILAQL